MRSILAFYEIDREYGGPEEGGWWYDSGTFVRAIALHFDDATALRTQRREFELKQARERAVDGDAADSPGDTGQRGHPTRRHSGRPRNAWNEAQPSVVAFSLPKAMTPRHQ